MLWLNVMGWSRRFSNGDNSLEDNYQEQASYVQLFQAQFPSNFLDIEWNQISMGRQPRYPQVFNKFMASTSNNSWSNWCNNHRTSVFGGEIMVTTLPSCHSASSVGHHQPWGYKSCFWTAMWWQNKRCWLYAFRKNPGFASFWPKEVTKIHRRSWSHGQHAKPS